MKRLSAIILIAAILVCSNSYAGNRGATLSDNQAKNAGLKIAWESHVTVDPSLSKFGNIFQYVGPKKFEIRFELKYAGHTQVISENDIDKTGNRIGLVRANELAQRRLENLKRLELSDATLTRQEIPVPPAITLYATNSSRTVHAIDGRTGRTLWKTNVGKSNRPSWVTANERFVVIVNGITVYCLDAKSGKFLWEKVSQGMPGSPPSTTETVAYVSMYNGTIQSFPLFFKKRMISQKIISPGRVAAKPLVTPNALAWANRKGYLNIASVDKGFGDGVRFRVQTGSDIAAAPTYHYQAPADGKPATKTIYVGTTSGDVYSVPESGAKVNWEFPTGLSIRKSPVGFGKNVYVLTTNESLIQVDAESGAENWRIKGIDRILTASKDKLYCMDSTGRILILAMDNGRRVSELPTEEMEIKVANMQNDRLFVGTKNGLFQCLHEVENAEPVFHIPLVQQAARKAQDVKDEKDGGDAGDAVDEPDVKPALDDPFAEEDGAAPAAGGAADDPADDDDPFGDE